MISWSSWRIALACVLCALAIGCGGGGSRTTPQAKKAESASSATAPLKDEIPEEHRDEVMTSYERNMERIRRGNPPELQAKLDAAQERLQARLREIRERQQREAQDARHSGGH